MNRVEHQKLNKSARYPALAETFFSCYSSLHRKLHKATSYLAVWFRLWYSTQPSVSSCRIPKSTYHLINASWMLLKLILETLVVQPRSKYIQDELMMRWWGTHSLTFARAELNIKTSTKQRPTRFSPLDGSWDSWNGSQLGKKNLPPPIFVELSMWNTGQLNINSYLGIKIHIVGFEWEIRLWAWRQEI